MPVRLTEQQYLELLQQQEQAQGEEYTKGRPDATRQRGHDGPAPVSPPLPVTPLITDIGEEWRKSKKWIPLLVGMMVPGVMPAVIIAGLFALFALIGPFGGIAANLTYLIERSSEWYQLMIRAGLSIGPGWCIIIAVPILTGLVMWYKTATK